MKAHKTLKHTSIFFFTIWLVSCVSIQLFAQDKEMDKLKASDFDPLKIGQESIFDDESFYLPPVAALIDSAMVNSPLLRQYDAGLEISILGLESTKKDWTDYLFTTSEVKYGSTDNVVFSKDDTEYSNAINAIVTTRYNVGVGLRMSLFDIVDRKRRIAIADQEMKLSQAKREEMIRQIRQEVTLLYNAVVLSQRILTIKSETQQAKILHFNLAEKQFLAGEIGVSEYATIIEMIAKSSAEYEKSKMDFTNTYFLLEEAVGINLQEIKKITE